MKSYSQAAPVTDLLRLFVTAQRKPGVRIQAG